MKITWVRNSIWLFISIIFPVIVWVGLRHWFYLFLLEVRNVYVIMNTAWIVGLMTYILGQVLRGIKDGGIDAWMVFMGPTELRTLAARLESMADKKEASEIYPQGATNGNKDKTSNSEDPKGRTNR